MTDLITAATSMEDHVRRALSLMKQGAHLTLDGIPGDPTRALYSFSGDVSIALHAQLADAQAAQAAVTEKANELLKAAKELAEYASYAEIVGGISVNRSQIRRECDAVFNAIRILPEDENYEKSFLATASGVETLAALRAERDELKQKLISPDPYEDTAHPDDHAVNRFAAAMKGKLAAKRLQGRGGWQEPEVPNGYLSRLLREHVDKGDPVDVANFAMMVHQRGERIAPENEGASCKAIDKAEADRDRLAAANAVLEAKVTALREAVDEQTKARAQHWLRRTMTAPEDAEVEALCERCGYGAVMDAASRLWARKPHGSGAFYIGGCIGFKSDEEARAALAEVQADARREGGE